MFKFVVQFLIVYFLFWNNKRSKGSWFTPSGVLIGIYSISAFLAIFDLMMGEWIDPFDEKYWVPMLEFDLFVLVFLLPFRQYNETCVCSIKVPNRVFLDSFSSIIIVLSFYSIIYYIGSVVFVFSAGDLRELREAQNEMGGLGYAESGILNTIASVSAANYVFAVILYFIYKIIGNSKKRCALLLLSSCSNILHVLTFVGRDGVVFWFFSFLFCYALFRPYLDWAQRKDFQKSMIRIGSIALVPFILISISRFMTLEGGVGYQLLTYLGQSFINGPLFFGITPKPVSMAGSFPLYYELTGLKMPLGQGLFSVGDWSSWHFSTFIVSLYRNFGINGLIATAVGMYFFFMGTVARGKNQLDLGKITIYLLYFQIISQGVFYFCQSTRGGNLFILTTLILGFIFTVITNTSSSSIVLRKKG